MADLELQAQLREEFGKGAARRLRRDNLVPAVLYSQGEEPTHISLPGHATMLALRETNALLTIKLPDGDDQLALPRLIQRHPVLDEIIHVDLLKVKKGEKVSVVIPVIVEGEPSDKSLLINHDLNEIAVLAEATNIPAEITVSVEGFDLGDQILAGDVKLPAGVELEEDPETLVVAIAAPISEEALEEALEAPEGDDAEVETVAESESDGADEE